jgi:hypothetical protein
MEFVDSLLPQVQFWSVLVLGGVGYTRTIYDVWDMGGVYATYTGLLFFFFFVLSKIVRIGTMGHKMAEINICEAKTNPVQHKLG